MIFASDLDQTLIYSERSMGNVSKEEIVPVELYEGRFISFMTKTAMDKLEQLTELASFVPVTTRTPEQYRRIFAISDRYRPTYAIVSNGGTVLVNGEPDPEWRETVGQALRSGCAGHAEVRERFDRIAHESWVKSSRLCDELFFSIVVERELVPEAEIEALKAELSMLGWHFSLQGRKIYLVPDSVTKGAALLYVKQRIGSEFVFGAGDSLLDESLLLASDFAVAPVHGELGVRYDAHTHIHFTRSTGILASEELLDIANEYARGRSRPGGATSI
ncbi:HAD family hydrolase [Cohnella hashimotonis]|uniref:HAD family hydrolase n=1 Tax=Cohnella hashimotonis TaxID=2826895 RepID=A0ABT6TEH3_9BACL|nr:HAD family hydrolase [Cohnella hashimotonis]MDI4644725.1 HAD family hydrolase [Cohnella hashimotonis]